jgi:hypothetical protein
MVVFATYLEKANSNAYSVSGTPQRTLIVRNWPWIAGKGLQDTSELEFDLLDG